MIKGMAQEYPTSLGTSDADAITLLGQNLANDLIGKVGFGELTLWMVTRRRPTQSEVRVFESVLVALADHDRDGRSLPDPSRADRGKGRGL